MFIGGLSWQTTPGTESKDIHEADDFSLKLWRFFLLKFFEEQEEM